MRFPFHFVILSEASALSLPTGVFAVRADAQSKDLLSFAAEEASSFVYLPD
jgi:hypothetical protein